MLACPGPDPGSIWDRQMRQPQPVVTLVLPQSAGKVVKPAHIYLSAQQIKVSLTLYYGTVFFKKDGKLAMLSQARDLASSLWSVQSGSPWKQQKTQSRQGISCSLLCSRFFPLWNCGLGWSIPISSLKVVPIPSGYLHVFCLNWNLGGCITLLIASDKLRFLTSLQWAPISLVKTLNLL